MADPVEIRAATDDDLEQINEIYNHYVRDSHCTFDVAPVTMPDRRVWFNRYATTGRYRLLMAMMATTVLGYATSSPYHERAAYASSVQTSIYTAAGMQRRGVGSALYAALFELLADEDVHRAYGGIALPNDASIALHQRFGFTRAGCFTEQGRKFGRYWDVVWYERAVA
ncbi:MAG TPA: GNAT family N-acetyltransferase [Acidimicrobiia bacterium]|nr:GNAT family N-acetyltransferase [Acidimicrobiia bacterium]